MKNNNTMKLAKMPDGPYFAQNSVILNLNNDLMCCNNENCMPSGSNIVAVKIDAKNAIEGKDYIILDTSDNILIGRALRVLNCGITIKPLNDAYHSEFIHAVRIKEVYLITDVHIVKN